MPIMGHSCTAKVKFKFQNSTQTFQLLLQGTRFGRTILLVISLQNLFIFEPLTTRSSVLFQGTTATSGYHTRSTSKTTSPFLTTIVHRATMGNDTLRLIVVPTASIKDPTQAEWSARMEIKGNLISLMDQGLFLSAETIDIRKGYLANTNDVPTKLFNNWAATCNKFALNRIVFLRGPGASEPEWTGIIVISANSLGTLGRCNVDEWNYTNILEASGFRELDNSSVQDLVYHYHRDYDENINCIYGNRHALKGIWPWPREEHVHAMTSAQE
ncbi:hypothetical protein QBC37DRAFT_432223 [Rhypophila decipiens]|uniref:Uncharacterized protein n=1 Tax=Rhypophila decipiens TaxID=261697 RepID=A0AAN7B2B1_9PEZI|nr:hypothetical protein QBC37DRAFT_432223 [Rhypophila decipiens]